MGRYDDESDVDIFENDIEVASLGPISLGYKPSKYEEGGGEGRGRSSRRDNDDDFIERGRSRTRSASMNSRASRSSRRSDGKEMPSVYSSRSVMEDQADVVGQCVEDDLRELATWRTAFTVSQVFAGVPVMVAQIPEAISFAFIAGIDPFIALQTTWIMNIVTSLIGGRPGLLSSVSGLGAIVIRMLVKHHGEQYIWYSVILSGFLQVIFSSLRLGKYLRIMPPAITIGLLNAVCLLTYALQLRYFKEIPTEETTVVDEDNLNMPWAYFYGYDLPWLTSLSEIIVLCCEALVALMICFLMPRFITVFPSTLVALVVVTAVHVGITLSTDYTSPDIDDYCTTELPTNRYYKGIFLSSEFELPTVFTWDTILAVLPAGVSLFCVFLIESMIAINVVDKFTSSDSEQDRVFFGQGFANCVVGFMGGMGGSPMALHSLHGLKSGGVSSVSTFFAGVYMLVTIIVAFPVIGMIPLGATFGVTIYLVCHAIQWSPFTALVLNVFPESCYSNKPDHLRLAVPDLLATFLSSWLLLFSSIYGLAGYLVGMICYACDPIGHAIVYGANEKDNTLIELNISSEHYFSKDNADDLDDDLDDGE